MTTLLEKIFKKSIVRHPHFELFREFDAVQLAKMVGVSTSYFRNILYGHIAPSVRVDGKINELAEALRAELEAQGAIVDDRG